MNDPSDMFPEGCRARVRRCEQPVPDYLGPVGTIYTISYCSDCGPDVVWLEDEAGEFQTIDRETLVTFFTREDDG